MTKLTEAQSALTAKKYKLAQQLFQVIVKEEPQNALAHQGLAQAMLRMRAYDEALFECSKALELDSNLALPHVVMAYANYGMKNLKTFRAEAREAYRLEPTSADVLACYGIMLLVDQDQDGAITALAEAVRINPADIVARLNLAHVFSLMGNTRGALEQAKQAFSISPSISTAMRLVSAFHEVHARTFGVLLVLSIVAAFLLRSNYLLLPVSIYATYALWMGLRLIFGKKWRPGLFGIGYAVLLIVIAMIVYSSIR